MPRSDEARIGDIIDAGRRIGQHIGAMSREEFEANDTVLKAVLFELAVIGEAAKGVSETAQSEYPNVPWSDMAGMRDIVIHQYFGVDVSITWNAATVSVPRVIGLLSAPE